MAETIFIGIRFRGGAEKDKPYKVQHGGDILLFKEGEVKVVDAATAQFLLSRFVHITDGKVVGMRKLFEKVELVEALKLVKAPENKSVAEAKKKAEEDEKKAAAIREAVLAEMKAQGWTPPKAPAPAGK